MSVVNEVYTALVYLADNPRPSGGEARYNTAHLYQLANQLRLEALKEFNTPIVRLPADLAKNIKDEGYYRAVCDMMDCIREAGGKMQGDE